MKVKALLAAILTRGDIQRTSMEGAVKAAERICKAADDDPDAEALPTINFIQVAEAKVLDDMEYDGAAFVTQQVQGANFQSRYNREEGANDEPPKT